MRTRTLVLLALLCGAHALAAQDAVRPPLLLVPRADTVFVYVEPAAGASGFVVYRSREGEAPVLLTAAPVRTEREPAMLAGALAEDLPLALQAMRASDAGELALRLHADRFGAAVLAMLSRRTAVALGRLYVDAGVTPGAVYTYRVVFTDGAGREGADALTARVTVRDGVLAPPGALRASGGDREAVVGWTYPRYRGDPADVVVAFQVYRADTADAFRRLTATPVLRNDAAPLEYHDREARNGATYRYRVTAVDVLGRESAPSEAGGAAPADRTPPAAPVGLAVQNGDGAVLVTWRLSPEPDVVGYHVERAASLHTAYRRLTDRPLPAERPSFADSAVSGGRSYFYRVVAVDSSGNTSAPSTAILALPVDRTPPLPPAAVTASLEARRLTVRWTRSPSRDVRGYVVYRGESAGAMAKLVSRPIEASAQYVDSGFGGAGLAPGRHYLLRVTAVDSAFNESVAATAEVTVPDDEPPSAPSAFAVRSVHGRYAEAEWSASTALDVRSYVLTRSEGASAPVRVGAFGAAERTARDTALAAGRRYVYTLVAVDSAGNRSAAVVDTLDFGDDISPAPPRAAAARVVPAGVEITWERVASPDLAGYLVYRSVLPTGTYERVTPAPVAELRALDPSGRPGFFYVVRAVDTSHNESASSPVAGVGAR